MKKEKQLRKSPQKSKTYSCLIESSDGFYLSENHAKMIWQGNKGLIVKSLNFKGLVGKLLYIIGGNESYGIIKILKITPINLKRFKELSERHRITEQERKLWWIGKQTLFAYEFDFVKKFDILRRVSIPEGTRNLLKGVKFLSDKKINATLTEKMKNIILVKNFVSFSGVDLNLKEKEKKDFLVKLSDPSDSMKRLIEARIGNSELIRKELNFIWRSISKKEDDFFPLYDLVLMRRDQKLFEVEDFSETILMKEFKVLDSSKTFSGKKDLLEFMFGE